MSLDDQTGCSLKKDDAPSCRSTIENRSERFSKQIKKKMIVIYRQLKDRFHMSSWSHSAPSSSVVCWEQPHPTYSPSTCSFNQVICDVIAGALGKKF